MDAPALQAAREAVDMVLTGHEPYPALAVDRYWTLVAANKAVGLLLEGVSPELLEPPVNVLRVSLHPKGLAPHIADLAQWRHHVLGRLHRQVDITADTKLAALHEELSALPAPGGGAHAKSSAKSEPLGAVVPLRLNTRYGLLSLFSTTTVFGTPVDVMLSELAIESFFPADRPTAELLRRISTEGQPPDA
nr:XRE family transcriptional regulator [Pyxidicoccus fallax]